MTEVHLNGQDAYSTYNQDNKIKKIQRADEFKVPVYTHSQMERPEKFGSNVGREAVASAVKPVFEQGGAIILNNLKVEVASSLGFGNSNINKENNYSNNYNNVNKYNNDNNNSNNNGNNNGNNNNDNDNNDSNNNNISSFHDDFNCLTSFDEFTDLNHYTDFAHLPHWLPLRAQFLLSSPPNSISKREFSEVCPLSYYT